MSRTKSISRTSGRYLTRLIEYGGLLVSTTRISEDQYFELMDLSESFRVRTTRVGPDHNPYSRDHFKMNSRVERFMQVFGLQSGDEVLWDEPQCCMLVKFLNGEVTIMGVA